MHLDKVGLGLDISKSTMEACLLVSSERPRRLELSNNLAGFQKLFSWLSGIPPQSVHVCLEPTGRYSRKVAQFLHSKHFRISQVNSFTVLSYGRSKNIRNKTDRIDAFLLADYCLKNEPHEWQPPEASLSQLKDIEARIDSIEKTIRQEKNRLEAGSDSDVVRDDIEDHLAELEKRKRRLEEAAKKLIGENDVLNSNYQILNSVVGLGTKSVVRLLALLPFDHFQNGRKAACYAGITPTKFESGTSIHKRESISRVGNQRLRNALYFPAMVAMQHNPHMRLFAERLKERGKPPKVIICAVMRKLLTLCVSLVRKQELYDPTKGFSVT